MSQSRLFEQLNVEVDMAKITPEEFAIIIERIANNDPTLIKLDLMSKGIQTDQAKEIAKALLTNSNLKTLILWSNKIGCEGVQAISEALQGNSTLISLDLRDNKIGYLGAKALAEMLRINSVLKILYLGFNRIGCAGIEEIVNAILANTSLTFVDFECNQIGIAGLQAIITLLRSNKTLTSFNIAYNKIKFAQLQEIVMALMTNKTLKNLNIASNSFGPEGIKLIATLLQINKTIESINISYNDAGIQGAQAVLAAIQNNVILTKLEFYDQDVKKSSVVLEIEEITTRNFTLQKIADKLYEKYQNPNSTESLSSAQFKFISNVYSPQNCLKTLEFFYTKFEEVNLNRLKSSSAAGLRTLVNSAMAPQDLRNYLPRSVLAELNKVTLFDFLKMQGVVKNPLEMKKSQKTLASSHSITKLSDESLQLILSFLKITDIKHKITNTANDNSTNDNTQNNETTSPSITPTKPSFAGQLKTSKNLSK